MNDWTMAMQVLKAPIKIAAKVPETKRCCKCEVVKPLTDFIERSDQPGKRRSECKVCNAKRGREYRSNGKMKIHKCQWCGKAFGRSGDPKFCSRSCQAFHTEAGKRLVKT